MTTNHPDPTPPPAEPAPSLRPVEELLDRLAAADRENAELRGEVERLARERDAYRKAKSENDDRFMLERDEARTQLAAAQAQLAEAREHVNEYDELLHAAEARLEAVRALADDIEAWHEDEADEAAPSWVAAVRTALGAPQPDRRPINARFYPDVEEEPLVMVDVDDESPASDEPARCDFVFSDEPACRCALPANHPPNQHACQHDMEIPR